MIVKWHVHWMIVIWLLLLMIVNWHLLDDCKLAPALMIVKGHLQ